jgi:hypothetical protein
MLGKQPEVQGMQHATHAGDRVVELQVAVVVPGERGDTVARLDTKSLQRSCKPVDARHHLAIRGAVGALIALRHYLFLLVQSLDPPQHVLQAELVVLHQAFHGRHLHHS